MDNSENGFSVPLIQEILNLKKSQIDKTLKFLTVESPSPIIKVGTKWHVTASAENYEINQSLIDEITQIRNQEKSEMKDYMEHTGCLMTFLQKALDDPNPQDCGQCKNCNPELLLDENYKSEIANRAALYLKRSYQPISPRKRWPAKDMFQNSPLGGYYISSDLQASEGRALSLWRDAGWGQLVANGKYIDKHFSDKLVTACVDMIHEWNPNPAPEWITCIPSRIHPNLVPDFAERLAKALNVPFFPCIEKIKANCQQKDMANSFQQAKNLDGVFNANLEPKPYRPCLLIDDIVDSRWTFTVASALLRQVGCKAVYPLALALNSPRMD